MWTPGSFAGRDSEICQLVDGINHGLKVKLKWPDNNVTEENAKDFKLLMDHYQLLGVPRDANSEDLKAAYKRQRLAWHPDKHQGSEMLADRQFKLITKVTEHFVR